MRSALFIIMTLYLLFEKMHSLEQSFVFRPIHPTWQS